MPIISISPHKKRGRSSWVFFPSQKIRVLDQGNFDGTTSTHDGIKARFRRQSSRVKSRLGIPSKDDCGDDSGNHQLIADHNSFERDDTSSTIIRSRSHHSRRHSSSVPGMAHRLSHKFSSTFGYPTVVHRTSLRSRPSVRSVKEGVEPMQLESPTSPLDVSAASTYNSGSGSSPAQLSTNPTSDGLSTSPIRSTARNVPFTENSRMLTFTRDFSATRLTPIRETPNIVVPSIVTVEATATAKIFFETHFRQILSSHKPRSQRRKDLETVLESCNYTHAKRHKARAAFIRQENEFLRQDRVLKTRANAMKRTKGVSIAGYEVVKVLGKGSFGVVRLVKEKQSQAESQTLTSFEPTKRASTTDLAKLKSTARGAFPLLGYRKREVTKVKKEVYAMKVIRKSEMIRNSQEGHLRAERDFLVASENSRWIVPLIAAFQDNKNLYLVMDYCVGGDFLGLLIRKNTLSEDVTRWYIAEMILCVEEAHSLRWIHRDVKPDNFLIGVDGHLKISDFGLAFDGDWAHDQAFFYNHRHSLMEKLGIEVQGDEQDKTEAETAKVSQNIGKVMARPGVSSGKEKKTKAVGEPADDEPVVDWRNKNQRRKLARSVVGTSQYMAPEVIRGDLYDGRCDWWSIGIILYECLFGFTPFACENRQETKLKILKHRAALRFPDDQYGYPPITSEVLDLMRRMLSEKEERLSSPKYYLNDYAYSQAEDPNTYHILGPADKSSKSYQGRHVYSDDADDIKAHPWFKGTDWTQIHKKKPPFIPKVKSWEDTKYFDDDESVSETESSSSEEDDAEPTPVSEREDMLGVGNAKQDPQVFENAVAAAANMDYHPLNGHQHENQHIIPSNTTKINELIREQNQKMLAAIQQGRSQIPSPSNLRQQDSTTIHQPQFDGDAGAPGPAAVGDDKKSKRPKKEKKRPRDKILRDQVTAKIALEMRRKGAFLGYAYRRPKDVQSVLERVENEVEIGRAEIVCRGCGEVHPWTQRGRRGNGYTNKCGNGFGTAGGGGPCSGVDGRRDSAISGIAGLGSAIGTRERAGEREREREVETSKSARERAVETAKGGGRRGANTPSPRCITPVENLGTGLGTRRGAWTRFPDLA